MSRLVESHLELAAIEWLEELGYSYSHGDELKRPDKKEVVLVDRLEEHIAATYPHLPETVRKEVVSHFVRNESADLDYRNREFHKKLKDGYDFVWEDEQGVEHQEHVYAINYDKPVKNDFLVVNQLRIKGRNDRRPDLLVYVNGLPLVVFEFKNMFDEGTTWEDAYNQIQHYKIDLPKLFEYNELTVLSDGLHTLHGMYSSSEEWFAAWKSVNGVDIVPEEKDFQLHSLLKGLFPKDRLLHYIKYFIFHEKDKSKLIKKGAKYHQYFGIRFAVEATKKGIKPIGDGRIGVIWHTQGSGKSISMAIYSTIISKLPVLNNPTIVIQVDRNDLDQQLYDNFVKAKDLVGNVEHAEDVDDLRELLSTNSGGIIFTTIEKFRLKRKQKKDNGEPVLAEEAAEYNEHEHPILSERDNIIVIADEAHRTQYGLLEGYAANLRKALPNASFIGFTGTPVDSKDADTEHVFGETIHTYDMKQATDDKATVGIIYEPRLAKLHLANEGIEEEAEEIIGSVEGTEANRLKWADLADAAGAEERVNNIAKDILAHYQKRTETLPGKAMIVCMSRANCVKMYDALTALEGCPEVKVIMTGNISKDPKEWNEAGHIRTKEQREAIKSRFKDENDPLQIVIVRDMWLTGFDAPCVHTMYIDKVMQGHNLMQAITRVNRVFGDKTKGVIVDYIGIGDYLQKATKKYTSSGGKGKPAVDIDEAMEELHGLLEETKTFIPEEVDYSKWKALTEGQKFLLVQESLGYIVAQDDRAEQFMILEKKITALSAIVKSHEDIPDVALDILYLQHVGAAVRKLKFPGKATQDKHKEIKKLINRSIDSEEVIDVFAMAGIEKPDISILSEEFMLGVKDSKSGAAIKAEMLRQILNNEIKLRQHKNQIRMKNLKEEVEKVIERYHKGAISSYQTILELLEQAQKMQEEDRRTKELGLSEEEIAFYDILNAHKEAIRDYEQIQGIVQNVVRSVKKELEIDWKKKPDAKAAIRLAVKKELRRGKVKLSELESILNDIMEQAEGQFGDFGN
jgi:type I restriction enzyme, R subunit